MLADFQWLGQGQRAVGVGGQDRYGGGARFAHNGDLVQRRVGAQFSWQMATQAVDRGEAANPAQIVAAGGVDRERQVQQAQAARQA